MDNVRRIPRLIEWSLTTFHTAFFFAVVFTLLYRGGNLGALLASLNSFIGISVYGAFWLTTWWCTRHALKNIAWATLEKPLSGSVEIIRVLGLAALWGAVDGMLFLVALIPVGLIVALMGVINDVQFNPTEISTSIFIPVALIFVLLFGLPIAAMIGGFFGMLFALIDGLLLVAAGFVFNISTTRMNRREISSQPLEIPKAPV